MNGSEYYKRWAIVYLLLVALAAIFTTVMLAIYHIKLWLL